MTCRQGGLYTSTSIELGRHGAANRQQGYEPYRSHVGHNTLTVVKAVLFYLTVTINFVNENSKLSLTITITVPET